MPERRRGVTRSRRVTIHAFVVREPTGEVRTDGRRPWDWIDPSSLVSLPMPEANRAILRALAWRPGLPPGDRT